MAHEFIVTDIYELLPANTSTEYIATANVGLIVFCSLMVVIGSMAMHLLNARVPTLIFGGMGLMIIASGVVVYTLLPGMAPFAAPVFIFSFGEVLVYPVCVAAVVRGWHWRSTTAVATLFYLSLQMVSGPGWLFVGATQNPFIGGVILVTTVVCAILLFGLAIPVYRHQRADPLPGGVS